MKLPASNANHIKIPLSCLKITDNVRMNFNEAEIEELANSIRQNGLMNPITVRPPETDADGNKTYEVIAGGRRIRAHQWLCEHGDDFSLIECCIRTGDKWTLQMIENIQRTDLTPREKENAVAKALEEGLTQTQIADKLSKPIQWVSDIVAGTKIRKIADAAGLNTEEITTKTLSQLRSIPKEKLESCLTQLIADGGTYRAATRMMQEEKNPATTHVSTPDEDFIPEDESMISPSEMSEEEFYDDEEVHRDNAFAKSMGRETPEHDGRSGQERFAPGTIISHAGKRLFFADLYVGKEFVHASDKNSAQHLKVCKVSKIDDDCFEYIDGDRCCGEYSGSRKKYIDSEVCEHNDWIYEIPDDAVAVKVSDMQPFKTDPKPQKILQNSDEIPVINLPSEQPLTVGMLMNELQKIPQSNFVLIKANGNLYEVHYVSVKKNNLFLTTYADIRYQKL